ncbi:hypothetical protein HDU93_002322 [Gonapodya sp. JEL0774]|nr:hypothetical protein HDU93_002322 [Gonapodya sp. JEL0774]
MAKQINVLLLDPVPESALEIFQYAKWKVDSCFEQLSEAQLTKKIGDYQIVCLKEKRPQEYLTDEGAFSCHYDPNGVNQILMEMVVIRSAHRLLAIGCFSQYTDQIDLKAAQEMGIPVFSSPYGHSYSVAELSICFIISLARQLMDRSMEMHRGEWNKVSSDCYEVRGKTLGIVGYGHIGSQLGVMAESIGMRVIFYDIATVLPIGRSQPQASLAALLPVSDFVAICVSPTAENRHLFGENEIRQMKKGAYLINTSYSEAVDFEAAAQALKAKNLAGAAFDVFPNTPLSNQASFQHPFASLKNVIMVPNLGDATQQAHERVGHDVANSIVRFLNEGASVGAVNFPSIQSWPLKSGTRRILNMHRNVRGVLKEIDYILSAYNVGKQVLETNGKLGYAPVHKFRN